jgi:hypothetical protein
MIEYVFKMSDGREDRFVVEVERGSRALPVLDEGPFWSELGYEMCPSCPLAKTGAKRCPPAVDLTEVLTRFAEILSIETAVVRVIAPERTFEKQTDTQTALQSLLGLIMATSACPVLGRLKPLARMHLPFATVEETIARTAGSFLVAEYFRAKDGGLPDWNLEGLRGLYMELQDVNMAFAARIRAAAKRDASLNAISLLFSVSVLVSASLEADLAKVRTLYR